MMRSVVFLAWVSLAASFATGVNGGYRSSPFGQRSESSTLSRMPWVPSTDWLLRATWEMSGPSILHGVLICERTTSHGSGRTKAFACWSLRVVESRVCINPMFVWSYGSSDGMADTSSAAMHVHSA